MYRRRSYGRSYRGRTSFRGRRRSYRTRGRVGRLRIGYRV